MWEILEWYVTTTIVKTAKCSFGGTGHPSSRIRDLGNLCQGALKLFWRHMVEQHPRFSFNLSPICLYTLQKGELRKHTPGKGKGNLFFSHISTHIYCTWNMEVNPKIPKIRLFVTVHDSFRLADTSFSNDIDGTVHTHLHSLYIYHASVLACTKI